MCLICVFFFKQKTAYEMRISDWSSDVCSSDLRARNHSGCGRARLRQAQVNPTMELLQSILLALTAGTSALLIGRARRCYGEADQPALFSALLGFILTAASAACSDRKSVV